MGDYKYLVHQFQSQESARWKNKIENNRLANEIDGKGGIEYERAFHLRNMDKERRRIQDELDLIRRHGRRKGVRRSSKPEIITTSLNPPLTKAEPSERRPARGFLDRRATLTGYYDIPGLQRTPARIESKIAPPAEYVGQPTKNSGGPILIKFDPREGKSPKVLQAEGIGEEPPKGTVGTPLTDPAIYHRRHMVQFVEEEHLTHNKGKNSKFGPGSVSYQPSGPGEQSSVDWSRQYKVGSVNQGTALNELNVNTARENVARRLGETGTGLLKTPGVESKEAAERGDLDKDTSQADGVAEETESNPANSTAPQMDQEQNSGKSRRSSKSEAVNEILKGSKFDAEKYNPDGSLRTKHQVPSFEESYEQARKARYIRSKERSDLDKELSIQEVFDKSDVSDKQAGSG